MLLADTLTTFKVLLISSGSQAPSYKLLRNLDVSSNGQAKNLQSYALQIIVIEEILCIEEFNSMIPQVTHEKRGMTVVDFPGQKHSSC